MLIVVIYVIDL